MAYRSEKLNVATGGTGVSTITGVLTGNGTGNFTASTVSDNKVIMGSTSNLVQDTTINVTDSGEMTNTSQPCFAAYLATTATDVTGDATVYTIVFDGEVYDQGSDYSTSTGLFTCPVNGKYFFRASVQFAELGAGHTTGNIEFFTGGGSSRAPLKANVGAMRAADNTLTVEASTMVISTTATTTVGVKVTVSGSTKTVDIANSAFNTTFEGFLIC